MLATIVMASALLRPPQTQLSRRAALSAATAASGCVLLPSRAFAADAATATTLADTLDATLALPEGARAAAIALRPEYGLESADVVYPSWFFGRWKASSTLRSVLAPAGDDLFAPGRNGTEALRRARLETDPLVYEVKWRKRADKQDNLNVVVDRGYNVASISRAAMGSGAVQETVEDGPDHLTTYLKPKGAPPGVIYAADLRVVSRRTDPPLADRPNFFACAETTRQTVTTVASESSARGGGPPPSPLIKEINTIVTYEQDSQDPNVMRGYQRTATFLVPDAAYTGDPKLAELAAARLTSYRGRLVAVDVRVYDLLYTRV